MKRKPHKSKLQAKPASRERSSAPMDPVAAAANDASLVRLAEDVWRLAKRANREADAGWAMPLIERLDDDLHDLGVEIIDRRGTPYRDGENVEVLHSDVPPDWTGERVVTEVITPTVRIGGRVKGRGKVVIGAAN